MGIGKILFALPFVVMGGMLFLYAYALRVVMPSWLPGGDTWTYVVAYLASAVFIISSLMIVAGIKVKEAALALALTLVMLVLTIDLPGLQNPSEMVMSLEDLTKDISLMGAALLLAGMYWEGAESTCCSDNDDDIEVIDGSSCCSGDAAKDAACCNDKGEQEGCCGGSCGGDCGEGK